MLMDTVNKYLDGIETEDENDTEESSKITSPLKAIKAKCLDCCCGQYVEVKNCTCKDCPLWDFRLGKNPHRSRTVTEEQRERMRERAKKLAAEGKLGKKKNK